MKAYILILFALFSFNSSVFAEDAPTPPAYLTEFFQGYLQPSMPKLNRPNNQSPYFFKVSENEGRYTITLEVRIPNEQKRRSEWNIYSKYQFVFVEGEEQRKEPAEVRIHRSENPRGEYLGIAIEGQVVVNFNDNKLTETDSLPGLIRSLFRADMTLHPLFKNPLLPPEEQIKRLTGPQLQAFSGDEESAQKGLIKMYQEHRQGGQVHPMQALLMYPTGIGKSILAIKYLEFVSALHNGQKPTVVFLVENKIILADMVQKLQEQFPGAKIATLFGRTTRMDIDPDTQFILATRSTGFKRQDEIFDFLDSKTGPKVIYRDEAQHTGKVGGQFNQMLVEIMNRFSSDTQVIDMTATPWHIDALDLIKQYQGRVATSFVTADEYQKLIMGQQVDRIARLQLVRAILDGWLSPLDSLTFITHDSEQADGQTFRNRLLREQQEMLDRLGLDFQDDTLVKLSDLSEEDVAFLKREIRKVHKPIVEELYRDLKAQILRDRSDKVAEYDRGIVFVPSIFHAEAYQMLLTEMAGQNMEFRVVHSKQSRTQRADLVEENIDWFNSTTNPYKHRYLISVDMLREGVDMPSVNRLVSATTSDSIKVLLQIFGRATRLSLLKSGIRLTDFGGSYLKFFQEIPGSLLKALFPIYDDALVDNSQFMSFARDKDKQKSGLVYDGEAIDVEALQAIQIEDPMDELANTGDRDARRVRGITPERVRVQVAIHDQIAQNLSWTAQSIEPNSASINKWLEDLLDWNTFKESPDEEYRYNHQAAGAFDRDLFYDELFGKYLNDDGSRIPLTTAEEEELIALAENLIEAFTGSDFGGYAISLNDSIFAINAIAMQMESFILPSSTPIAKNVDRSTYYKMNSDIEKLLKAASEKVLVEVLRNKSVDTPEGQDYEVEEVLEKREKDRRSIKFNKRYDFINFVKSNWRWLSLPWQYLVDDLSVEMNFYTDGHPLEDLYESLTGEKSEEFIGNLKAKGYNRVIDAIADGYYDFLPLSIAYPLSQAIENEPELVNQIVARVNLYPLLHTEEGRALLLDAERGIELVEFNDGGVILDPFEYYDRESDDQYTFYGYSHKGHKTKLEERSADFIWDNDYRWSLRSDQALSVFENLEMTEEVAALRSKSLAVGVPYSPFVDTRKKPNLLRLLSMSKLMLPSDPNSTILSSRFAQPLVDYDVHLGTNNPNLDSGLEGVVFSPNRTWVRRWVNQEAKSFFVQNRFEDIEHKLARKAFHLKAYESRPLLQESLLPSDSVLNRAAVGETLPPMLLDGLISQIDDLEETQIQEEIRLFMNHRFRSASFVDVKSPWLDSEDYEANYQIFNGRTLSQVKSKSDFDVKMWWEYLHRVVYNPEIGALATADQLKIARVLEIVGAEFQGSKEDLPEAWLEHSEWLLSTVPNSDLPFSFEGISIHSGNGIFQGTRMFMVLPIYFTIKYVGTGKVFRGVGPDRDRMLKQWVSHFEERYADQIKATKFESFYKIPDVVLRYLHSEFIKDIAKDLKGGPNKELYRRLAEASTEIFSEEVQERANSIYSLVSVGSARGYLKYGHDFEWFKRKLYEKLSYNLFTFEGYDSKSTVSAWDVMVDHLTGVEIAKVADRIKNQQGSLQTYSLGRQVMPAEAIEVSAEQNQSTPAGSCKAILSTTPTLGSRITL